MCEWRSRAAERPCLEADSTRLGMSSHVTIVNQSRELRIPVDACLQTLSSENNDKSCKSCKQDTSLGFWLHLIEMRNERRRRRYGSCHRFKCQFSRFDVYSTLVGFRPDIVSMSFRHNSTSIRNSHHVVCPRASRPTQGWYQLQLLKMLRHSQP